MNKKTIFNVPNLFSLLRLVIVPIFMVCFLNEKLFYSAIVLIISGLSDLVDGFFARKLNQITDLGKILDPLADKITLAAVAICMWIKYGSTIKGLPVMFSILILKELIMGAGGLIFFKKINMTVGSMWYGKLTTCIFYITMTMLVLIDVLNLEFTGKNQLYFYSILLVVLLAVFTFIKYCVYARTLYRNKEKDKNDAVAVSKQ